LCIGRSKGSVGLELVHHNRSQSNHMSYIRLMNMRDC
jgi:hypothetical protein